MATSTAPKRKMAATSLANLRPFSVQTKDEARSTGARGGVRSGEVRREKKRINEYVQDLLQGKVKDLPRSKEILDEICRKNGISKCDITARQVAATVLCKALEGDLGFVKEAEKADGSDLPTTENYNVANFIIAKDTDDIITRLQEKAKKDAEQNNESL